MQGNASTINYKTFFSLENLRNLLLLSLFFFLAGLVGLQLQSAQTGVTPVWPASGIALAFFIIYGFRVWPGIFIGMFALGIYSDAPLWLVLSASIGSVLECLVPLLVMQRYGFKGSLNNIREVLFFTGIITAGPVISSLLATFSIFAAGSVTQIPWQNILTLWWLGNSIGMLVFGGTILIIRQHIIHRSAPVEWLYFALITGISFSLSMSAFSMLDSVVSALIINLLIPVVFFSALRSGIFGTLLPALTAIISLLFISPTLPEKLLHMHTLNMLYLDIVGIWFISITGLVVAASYRDHKIHFKTAWLAHHDALTEIPNRFLMEKRIERSLKGNRRSDKAESLLFVDLDQMKTINDQAGHLSGDRLLRKTAHILSRSIRETDLVARWGGDEFVILLSDCSHEEAESIAEKTLQAIRDMEFHHVNKSFNITASIGFSEISPDDSQDSLLRRVDQALYLAKDKGKNCIVYLPAHDFDPETMATAVISN